SRLGERASGLARRAARSSALGVGIRRRRGSSLLRDRPPGGRSQGGDVNLAALPTSALPIRRAAEHGGGDELRAVRDLERGAEEVAVLVEAVDGADGVEDEVGQLPVAAGPAEAREQRREALGAWR